MSLAVERREVEDRAQKLDEKAARLELLSRSIAEQRAELEQLRSAIATKGMIVHTEASELEAQRRVLDQAKGGLMTRHSLLQKLYEFKDTASSGLLAELVVEYTKAGGRVVVLDAADVQAPPSVEADNSQPAVKYDLTGEEAPLEETLVMVRQTTSSARAAPPTSEFGGQPKGSNAASHNARQRSEKKQHPEDKESKPKSSPGKSKKSAPAEVQRYYGVRFRHRRKHEYQHLQE